jgi:putative inorganic carbon (HCO3(-)) transporter
LSLITAEGHAAPSFLRWELAAVALIAPILAFPPMGRPLLLFVPLLVPAMWIIAMLRGEGGLPVTPLNGALLLLLASILLSLAATFDIAFSTPKILGVVLGVVLFFGIVRAIRSSSSLSLALELYTAAGAAFAAISILGTNWIPKVGALQRIAERVPVLIRGVPGQSEGFQPNAIAGSLLLFIPLQLVLTISGPRRSLAAVLLVFTTAVLALTQSRNGWLSLLAALLLLAIWQSGGLVRKGLIIAGVAGIIAGGFAATHELHLVERGIGSGLSADLAGRMELWSRAVLIIEDFPFTGVGMNGFRRVMPAMYPVVLTPPEVDVAHAHNHLLQAGTDLGIPGLIAYLALWLSAAATIWRTWRGTSSRRIRSIASGLGGALLAFFAFGMVDTIALGAKVGIFFWVLLSLIVALDSREGEAAA